ncbi:hypothetical protein EZV62_002284 [Acer yangbiense]|uniref:Uncharacterized protein n=1 Tax=Acer yangbiense TaxID=1000413 RepID=A0A5C7IWU8_9ROSI|nr:hypothetical protein EZV62_002284 [Acer yangbiense]
MSSDKEDSVPRRRLSCFKCFDALWFCYSPVHQLQQYYRLGVLDNCTDKWSALVDCLTLKTKSSSKVEEILEARENAKPHIWTLRTPEEAASHWQKTFGDQDKME